MWSWLKNPLCHVLDMNDPTWYTIDENLATRERHTVNLDEALALAKKYVMEVRPFYESGEQAIAATRFGFSRSSNEFIEIDVQSPSEIAVRIELPRKPMPWIIRLILGPFQHEETVASIDALLQRVCDFFTMAPCDLREKLRYSR